MAEGCKLAADVVQRRRGAWAEGTAMQGSGLGRDGWGCVEGAAPVGQQWGQGRRGMGRGTAVRGWATCGATGVGEWGRVVRRRAVCGCKAVRPCMGTRPCWVLVRVKREDAMYGVREARSGVDAWKVMRRRVSSEPACHSLSLYRYRQCHAWSGKHRVEVRATRPLLPMPCAPCASGPACNRPSVYNCCPCHVPRVAHAVRDVGKR